MTHHRDGAPKRSEDLTDAVAAGLATELGAAAIWAKDGVVGDPNWDLDHPYRARLSMLGPPGPVVDLHIMKDRGFDICLGLGMARDQAPAIWIDAAELFVDAGFTVSINYPFPAAERTITTALQRRGRPALQVEMTWGAIAPDLRGPTTFAVLLEYCRRLV